MSMVGLAPHGAGGDAGRRLRALAEIGRLVSESLDPEAVMAAAAEATARLLGVENVWILLHEPAAGVLRVGAQWADVRLPADLTLSDDASLAGSVFGSGRPLVLDDVAAHPLWRDRVPWPTPPKGGIFVPFSDRESPLGVLAAVTAHERAFDEADVELLEALAAQVAVAVRNARLYQDARREAGRLATVLDVTRRLALAPALDEILARIAEEAGHLLGAQGAALRLREGDALVRAATSGLGVELGSDERLNVGESLMGRVVSEACPIAVSDPGADPRHRPSQRDRARALGVRTWLGVPLRGREGVLGALSVFRTDPRPFDDAEIDLLGAFADQAALAVENARLVAAGERRAAEALALAEVGRAVSGSLDLRAVLGLIVDQACRLLDARRSALALVATDGDRSIVRFVARRGMSPEFPDQMRPRHWRDGTTARSIAERQAVWSADVLTDPSVDLSPETRLAIEREGFRAVLSVPLLTGSRVLGALVIYRDAVGPFTTEEVDLLRVFATQAAVAVENARLHGAALRRGEELSALLRSTRTLMSGLDLEGTLNRICREAAQNAGTPHVRIMLVDADRRLLCQAAVHGTPAADASDVPVGTGYSGVVASTGRPLFVADSRDDPDNPFAERDREQGLVSYLGLPIAARGVVIGVLMLRTTEPRRYSSDELAYLQSFADQSALTIENARLFEQELQRRRQLEAVRDVTAELTRELDLTALLNLIVRRSTDLVGAASGVVCLWDDAEQRLVPRAWHAVDGWIADVSWELGEGITGMAGLQRRGIISNDLRTSPYALPRLLTVSEATACMAEPIVYQDRLVGTITLTHQGGRDRFSEKDRELVELFAGQAAVAIEHARLFEEAAAAEALGELARLKAEFLSTASHELRTPLSLIHGYSELLVERAGRLSAAEMADMAAEIHAGSRTMARLVDDLLDFSRLEQDRLQLQRRPVAVAEVLGRLVETFRGQPGGERIAAELPDGLTAELDPERLTQMVSNLLMNALRYAPSGPILLSASLREGDLVVEVADRGPGLSPAEQARVWEKFYRGESALTSPNRGSGLGLAMVKHLAELHGGAVGARGAPGDGATFWFRIPTTPSEGR